jgi:hypothetical protein
LRSELRFVSQDKNYAERSSVSYYLDRALMSAMRPDDVFQMARTECGELGVSVLRQGNLIFAAGEVSAAQLGSTIQARVPGELIQGAERLFRQHDPKFEFSELLIEIGSGEECSILFHGFVSRNGYHTWVRHGFFPGVPGTAECVAISLNGACDHTAVCASAQLLEISE